MTHEQWKINEAKRLAKLKKAAGKLTEDQAETLKLVYKTLAETLDGLHHDFDLTIDDCRNIDKSFWKMRQEFGFMFEEEDV